MRRVLVAVVAGLLAFIGIFYFMIHLRGDAGRQSAAKFPASESTRGTPSRPIPVSGPPPRPQVQDPRLAALIESPASAIVEWVPDADGRVMREMDADSTSPGYRKPLREYLYTDGHVSAITRYRYLGNNQVEVSTARVAYRVDGSIDQILQSSRVEQASSIP